ncbi:hypothetical protein FD29_GL002187 [Companilactobacillus mindensis DSM 14500]|uniref:Uncharacterized protein n=1 Tax=Companilactobacillus mindensis DSM 14500 TaxID=1423770 RepID=A0A0R1QIV8_9LACO|nr:hypothetical protein [Companilactobacillus mindensis]KRL44430.1 hypothetical protein FD29_GL002187 [Companilactobacillus mindensis DSM 14500]
MMNSASQMIFDITSIALTVAIIVGVVLISIALFRIIAALKYRNQMLFYATRPYIFCQKHPQQLEIRNNGAVPIVLDKLESNLDLSKLSGQTIPSGQSFFYNVATDQLLTLKVDYHDKLNHYQDNFNL